MGDGIAVVSNFDAFYEALSNDSRYLEDPNEAPNGARIAQALINGVVSRELSRKIL